MRLSIKNVNITKYKDMQSLELARRIKYTILLELQLNDKELFNRLFEINNARIIIAKFYPIYERKSNNFYELKERIELALKGCDLL